MTLTMRRLGYLALSLGLGFVAQSASAGDKVSIKFTNKSDFSIHHIYLSETKENEWGPDQLGDKHSDVVEPGSSFTLTDIKPNKYDIKIVDEDEDECVVGGVKVAASENVILTNKDLVGCQVASAEAEDEEAAG